MADLFTQLQAAVIATATAASLPASGAAPTSQPGLDSLHDAEIRHVESVGRHKVLTDAALLEQSKRTDSEALQHLNDFMLSDPEMSNPKAVKRAITNILNDNGLRDAMNEAVKRDAAAEQQVDAVKDPKAREQAEKDAVKAIDDDIAKLDQESLAADAKIKDTEGSVMMPDHEQRLRNFRRLIDAVHSVDLKSGNHAELEGVLEEIANPTPPTTQPARRP